MVASSFVSYLGPFNNEFRELLMSRDFCGGCSRLGVPYSPDLNVTKFLVEDAEVGEWNLQVHLYSTPYAPNIMCDILSVAAHPVPCLT